jgi:hypothetical protein
VFSEVRFGLISFIAQIALISAEVFGHVHIVHDPARQNNVADLAGGVAQVRLQVLKAGRAATVRLLAHCANETPLVVLDYLIRRYFPRRPRSDGSDEWTICN